MMNMIPLRAYKEDLEVLNRIKEEYNYPTMMDLVNYMTYLVMEEDKKIKERRKKNNGKVDK